MKKSVALLLAILMMLTMGMTVYAESVETDVVREHKIVKTDLDTIMPMGNCAHPSLVRITANSVRYVSVSGSFHTKEEYFTARCSECMKYQKEIIDSQVLEQHTMVLVISDCNEVTKKHRYVYVCQGKCNYQEEITLNCPGIHEVEGAAVVGSDEDE